jgi:hypothetical protein
MEALDVVLLVADAVEEADAVDAERAKRDEAPKRKATTRRVLALREFASTIKDQVDNLYSRVVMRRSNVPANAWKARRWPALSQRRRCVRSHSLPRQAQTLPVHGSWRAVREHEHDFTRGVDRR